MRDIEGDVVVRLPRMADEFHISLFGGSARLAPVTGSAGADNILPAVFTVLVTRHNVVYGKLVAGLGAVLAGIVVTLKNAEARHFPLVARAFNHISQLDY